MIGHDEAFGEPDHTGPDAPAAATNLHDASLRVLDHPRAGQDGGGDSR
jgi:hypothetical protein